MLKAKAPAQAKRGRRSRSSGNTPGNGAHNRGPDTSSVCDDAANGPNAPKRGDVPKAERAAARTQLTHAPIQRHHDSARTHDKHLDLDGADMDSGVWACRLCTEGNERTRNVCQFCGARRSHRLIQQDISSSQALTPIGRGHGNRNVAIE